MLRALHGNRRADAYLIVIGTDMDDSRAMVKRALASVRFEPSAATVANSRGD